MIIFSIESYKSFAEKLAQEFNFPLGAIERNVFPDGETYHRLLTRPDGEEVAIVGGTGTERDTLELFDLACGLTAAGVRSLKLVVPYFGYSTMERAVKIGEIVKAKTRAMLFSAIPPGDGSNEIILLDLHSEGIPYYFSNGLLAVHLYAKPVITAAARDLGGENFVLGSTDAGRAKWVQSLALDMGVEAAFVYKRRESGAKTSVTGVNANVRGRRVIIYDDMIRTGGSLLQAAEAYLTAGAKDVAAVTTHLLTPGDARQRLQASGLLRQIIGTDSTMRPDLASDDFIQIRSVTSVFGAYLAERLQW